MLDEGDLDNAKVPFSCQQALIQDGDGSTTTCCLYLCLTFDMVAQVEWALRHTKMSIADVTTLQAAVRLRRARLMLQDLTRVVKISVRPAVTVPGEISTIGRLASEVGTCCFFSVRKVPGIVSPTQAAPGPDLVFPLTPIPAEADPL